MNIKAEIRKFDTPLYIYDKQKIYTQIEKLYEAIPKGIDILYSLKANSNIHLIKTIYQKVYGVEASSQGEIYLALQAGVLAKDIIFVGPAKKELELEYAIEKKISMIVVDSFSELEKINRIACKHGMVAEVSLRINPQEVSSHSSIRMGGGAKQFGIDEEKIKQFCMDICVFRNVKVVGMHCYIGTQNLKYENLIFNFETALDVAKRLQKNLEQKLKFVDIGGGFGIPNHIEESELDLLNLKKEFEILFQKNREYFSDSCCFFVESGRFIVGPSGYFVCKIIDKKESRGKTFLIVDGGTNCGPTSYINGRFLRRNPIISFYGENLKKNRVVVDIVGPLCTSTDFLAQDIIFPVELNIGDYIIIENAGAYGYMAASKDFLSHFYPEEILLDVEYMKVIRKKNNLESMLAYF